MLLISLEGIIGRAAISRKQFVWLEHYLQCWNATEAARRAGYRCPRISGPESLHKPALARAIKTWVAERAVTADEALLRLGEQARADIGVFFKAVERWLEDPLPTMEVLDQRVDVDDEGNRHVVYLVRQVVLDIDKLLDPQFSRVV